MGLNARVRPLILKSYRSLEFSFPRVFFFHFLEFFPTDFSVLACWSQNYSLWNNFPADIQSNSCPSDMLCLLSKLGTQGIFFTWADMDILLFFVWFFSERRSSLPFIIPAKINVNTL